MAKRRSAKKQISTFNAVCFALAAVLFSYSILSESPERLTHNVETMLGNAVGAFAAVPANPYNTLAAQLEEKERALDLREEVIESRMDIATYSFILSVSLLLLLSVNFYLDWRRARKVGVSRAVVPSS